MLQSVAQSQDWFYQDPLFLDDDFCQSLIKDLDLLPTPPQSPPMKAGMGSTKPLSKEDQLSYVSDILLEDHDMQHNWSYDLFNSGVPLKEGQLCSPLEESGDDCLWQCLAADKSLDEKFVSTVLGSSPLLSDIDTSIFEGLAGSTLDCQQFMETPEPSEATSDYGSAGGEFSTSSSSDSEEEIDVVGCCTSNPLEDLSTHQQVEEEEEEQRDIQRHQFEIQLQHNYAAPCPASPPPSSSSSTSNKRSRGSDSSSRFHYSSRSSSASSRYHHSSRNSTETEDEEERRRTHNVMERQRRNELKNCFMRLRDKVPELSHNDKASKVVILKKARDCIHGLEDEGQRLQTRKGRLRAKQEVLKARLEQLRS